MASIQSIRFDSEDLGPIKYENVFYEFRVHRVTGSKIAIVNRVQNIHMKTSSSHAKTEYSMIEQSLGELLLVPRSSLTDSFIHIVRATECSTSVMCQ